MHDTDRSPHPASSTGHVLPFISVQLSSVHLAIVTPTKPFAPILLFPHSLTAFVRLSSFVSYRPVTVSIVHLISMWKLYKNYSQPSYSVRLIFSLRPVFLFIFSCVLRCWDIYCFAAVRSGRCQSILLFPKKKKKENIKCPIYFTHTYIYIYFYYFLFSIEKRDLF